MKVCIPESTNDIVKHVNSFDFSEFVIDFLKLSAKSIRDGSFAFENTSDYKVVGKVIYCLIKSGYIEKLEDIYFIKSERGLYRIEAYANQYTPIYLSTESKLLKKDNKPSFFIPLEDAEFQYFEAYDMMLSIYQHYNETRVYVI